MVTSTHIFISSQFKNTFLHCVLGKVITVDLIDRLDNEALQDNSARSQLSGWQCSLSLNPPPDPWPHW